MSARNPFAKFSLKPSSLSQHTVNFNKILEDAPSPKIEQIILEKPILGLTKTDVPKVELNSKETELTDKKYDLKLNKTAAPSPAFVFGEQLTDRVTNVTETTEQTNDQAKNGNDTKEISESNNFTNNETKPTSIFGNTENEAEKYNSETHDANTLIRMKCKIFVLDKDQKDQASWSERGYGTLKMIDSNDDINCRIMMWTDKCFRLVLNTKLFESMTVEKVNRKSIRMNAQDEATIKMFLIKCGHPNECEELFEKMIYRLKIYTNELAKSNESKTEVLTDKTEKGIVFECDCESETFFKDTKSSRTSLPSKLKLYKKASKEITEKSELLLDITNIDDQSEIISNINLKSIISEKSENENINLEQFVFQIKESFDTSHKVTIKDSQSIKNFIKQYKEQMDLTSKDSDTSYDDSLNNEPSSDDDGDEEKEEEDEVPESSLEKKSDSDSTLQNSSVNKNDESDEKNANKSKKRKTDDDETVKNENKKLFTEPESAENVENTSYSLKRTASLGSSQENTEEMNKQFYKKTKVKEDEIF